MKHLLTFVIIPMMLITVGAAYVKYYINKDYVVTYEAYCDPNQYSCFEGCEDDECTELYYYSYITRPADEIYQLCGEDITDCDESNYCESDSCSIEYCNESSGGCSIYLNNEANLGE